MSVKWKYVISLLIAIILGTVIYHRSSMPPYGHPINELSDNYWGVIVDIAHRWRQFDLGLWSRSLGGGMSLFTSGQYPVLNPTNALAWVFNDDQFYLIKLIEPYVLGFFFMMVLLWDVFKTRWYIACFGGMAYMGLTLAKATTMAQSPYFLYGCGLFPGMVLVFLKLAYRHTYWAALGVGVMVAMQFLGEGVTQLPQLIIWWGLFLLLWQWQAGHRPSVKQGAISIFIFMAALVTLSAIQLIPSIYYVKFESARTVGHYPINNFVLWGKGINQFSFSEILWGAFFNSGSVRTRGILFLILACLVVAIVNAGRLFKSTPYKDFIIKAWLVTGVYLCIPTATSFLVQVIPVLDPIFGFMTRFSFIYGLHTLDFCIILTLCLIINDESLRVYRRDYGVARNAIGIFLISLVLLLVLLLPMFLLFPSIQQWPLFASWHMYFLAPTLKYGMTVGLKALAMVILVAFKSFYYLRHWGLIFLLFGMGFMMMLDCFKWYDKGCRTFAHEYQMLSPEYDYFRKAQGKYFFPYHAQEPVWGVHNYNLLYGVDGSSGFMAMAPRRLSKFQFYYNNRLSNDVDSKPFLGNDAKFIQIYEPIKGAFTTYFPVDFTMAQKSVELPWPNFTKVVSGESYDVYERINLTPRVYFADQLRILPLPELVRRFDEPRTNIVYVASEDAKRHGLAGDSLAADIAQARYWDFKEIKENHLSFRAFANKDTFVIVPENYQAGWQITIDGRKVEAFPADYLFVGFKMLPGEHTVEVFYMPPWFWVGFMMMVLGLIGVGATIFRLKSIRESFSMN